MPHGEPVVDWPIAFLAVCSARVGSLVVLVVSDMRCAGALGSSCIMALNG